MNKTALSVLAVILLIAGSVVPVMAQQTQEAQVVPAPAADVQAVEVESAVATPAYEGSLAPIPVLELGAAWSCPYGAPFCSQHDDCDAYCGDPRFGYCSWNGCCSCTG